MTVPSVSSRVVPRLTGGLLVVRVQGDRAGVVCISAGGLAGINGTWTPNAHGKAGLLPKTRRGGKACAKHEAASRKVPRTTANNNEADLRVSIARFYLMRCSEAKLRREGSAIRGQPPLYDFEMTTVTTKVAMSGPKARKTGMNRSDASVPKIRP